MMHSLRAIWFCFLFLKDFGNQIYFIDVGLVYSFKLQAKDVSVAIINHTLHIRHVNVLILLLFFLLLVFLAYNIASKMSLNSYSSFFNFLELKKVLL